MTAMADGDDHQFDVLAWILEASQSAGPDTVGALANEAAGRAGLGMATVFLVDHEQISLRPLAGGDLCQPLVIDATLAGRCYTSEKVQLTQADGNARLWVPLIDGSDRFGVIGFDRHEWDDSGEREARALTAAVAQLVVAKNHYTDAFRLCRRSRPMTLGADLVWSQLPPQAFTGGGLTIAAVLAPAYDLGGDAYDYAVNDGILEFAIFDAMGHGTPASLLATLTLAAYRHGRRLGQDLASTAEDMDAAIALTFPDQFVTGHLGRLHTSTGQLHLVNAGHHLPLLMRAGRVVGSPAVEPRLPFGLGPDGLAATVVSLQPGDQLLFFTDGVIEAHGPSGDPFGSDRLADLVGRESLSGQPAAEILRRASHAVLEHLGESLSDDATLLIVEWEGPA